MDAKSYCMGLFDGEGCITAGKMQKTGRWQLIVSCTLCSEAAVTFFQDTWGGGKNHRNKPTTGGLILWTWTAGARSSIPFLEYASEHSLVKREQAVLALGLARNIARYATAGRKRAGMWRGQKFITPEDLAERERIVSAFRALNGARRRWQPEAVAT